MKLTIAAFAACMTLGIGACLLAAALGAPDYVAGGAGGGVGGFTASVFLRMAERANRG